MDILFENQHIAACVKPVGLDSEHELPQALSEMLGGSFFCVHRLDKNVGGVMVYARTKAAAAELNKTIQDGTMVKEYVALVHGTPPAQGDWEDLLFKDSAKNKVFVVKTERKGVKKARLEFLRITESDPALMRIRLHTGRSHQIRVQFSSRGYPLVGDRKYGARDDSPDPMLFSCRLSFPLFGQDMSFEAMPPWTTI